MQEYLEFITDFASKTPLDVIFAHKSYLIVWMTLSRLDFSIIDFSMYYFEPFQEIFIPILKYEITFISSFFETRLIIFSKKYLTSVFSLRISAFFSTKYIKFGRLFLVGWMEDGWSGEKTFYYSFTIKKLLSKLWDNFFTTLYNSEVIFIGCKQIFNYGLYF